MKSKSELSNHERSLQIAISESIHEGMHIDQVKDFLISKTIEYSVDESERKIYAIVRKIDKGVLVHSSITMEFAFNSDMELQTLKVEKVFTGP